MVTGRRRESTKVARKEARKLRVSVSSIIYALEMACSSSRIFAESLDCIKEKAESIQRATTEAITSSL